MNSFQTTLKNMTINGDTMDAVTTSDGNLNNDNDHQNAPTFDSMLPISSSFSSRKLERQRVKDENRRESLRLLAMSRKNDRPYKPTQADISLFTDTSTECNNDNGTSESTDLHDDYEDDEFLYRYCGVSPSISQRKTTSRYSDSCVSFSSSSKGAEAPMTIKMEHRTRQRTPPIRSKSLQLGNSTAIKEKKKHQHHHNHQSRDKLQLFDKSSSTMKIAQPIKGKGRRHSSSSIVAHDAAAAAVAVKQSLYSPMKERRASVSSTASTVSITSSTDYDTTETVSSSSSSFVLSSP